MKKNLFKNQTVKNVEIKRSNGQLYKDPRKYFIEDVLNNAKKNSVKLIIFCKNKPIEGSLLKNYLNKVSFENDRIKIEDFKDIYHALLKEYLVLLKHNIFYFEYTKKGDNFVVRSLCFTNTTKASYNNYTGLELLKKKFCITESIASTLDLGFLFNKDSQNINTSIYKKIIIGALNTNTIENGSILDIFLHNSKYFTRYVLNNKFDIKLVKNGKNKEYIVSLLKKTGCKNFEEFKLDLLDVIKYKMKLFEQKKAFVPIKINNVKSEKYFGYNSTDLDKIKDFNKEMVECLADIINKINN